MAKNKSFLEKYWFFLISFCLILTLVISYFFIPGFQKFASETWSVVCSKNEEKISNYCHSFGIWGPVFLIVLIIMQIFLVFVPNLLPMVVAVLGYGPFWGSVICIVATFGASTVGFFLGKSLQGSSKWQVISKERYNKLQKFIKEYGLASLILFRVSPFVSNDAISILSGILRMDYWRYMAATMAGTIPLVIAVAFFASDMDKLKAGLYWIGGGGVVLLGIYIWLSNRRKAKSLVKKAKSQLKSAK